MGTPVLAIMGTPADHKQRPAATGAEKHRIRIPSMPNVRRSNLKSQAHTIRPEFQYS